MNILITSKLFNKDTLYTLSCIYSEPSVYGYMFKLYDNFYFETNNLLEYADFLFAYRNINL